MKVWFLGKCIVAHFVLLGWLRVFGGLEGVDSLLPVWGSYVWRAVFYFGVMVMAEGYGNLFVFYSGVKNSDYLGVEVMSATLFYVKVVYLYLILFGLLSMAGVALVKCPFFVRDYLILLFLFVLLRYGDYVFPSYARYQRLVREGEWMRR
jgi:hypothetical protein